MQVIWQDVVIGLASVFYIISEALIIKSTNKKPPVSSAIITATFDFIVFVTFLTLHLWFAAITSLILFIEWVIIGWQSHQLSDMDRSQ